MADGNYSAEVTAKAVSAGQPTLTEQPALMVLDPLDPAYPGSFNTIDTIKLNFGFVVDGDTDIDVVKFSDADGKDTYAMIVNEDHALAQPGGFSMPVGTVIVLDVDSAGTYSVPTQFQTLLDSSSPEDFAENAIALDAAGVGQELQYLVDAKILEDDDVAAITFTDAYTFGLVNQSSSVDGLSGSIGDTFDAPSAKIMQTIFYSNLAKNPGVSAIVYDFEGKTAGNFVSGSSTTGTAGTLNYDGMLSVHLFNTANNSVSDQSVGDDPGIATHTGNNADRGFNTTPGSAASQYLEILPSNSTASGSTEGLTGGAIFEFYHDESLQANTRVEAFGFNLMGVEDAKRDVVIDIFIADTSDPNGDEFEISVIREFVQGSQTQGGVQYISYAIPSGPEFENKALVGFSIIEPGNVSGTDDRDIYSVDDLVLAVNSDSSFSGLVAPQTLLDAVMPSGGGQSDDNGGQGAMPSEDAPGPFWVDDEDVLILTNIGATSSFQPNLQIVAADLETLELYDREMLQLVKGTKGHIALDFEVRRLLIRHRLQFLRISLQRWGGLFPVVLVRHLLRPVRPPRQA